MKQIDVKLKIIACGGTICKYYNMRDDSELYIDNNLLKEIISDEIYDYGVKYSFKNLLEKDSLYMSDNDRISVADYCQNETDGYDRLLVTHGTDSMQETAKIVANRKLNKTIVFVGSMVPYKINKADAITNLSSALVFCQLLPAGVYICAHGVVFPCDNVTKTTFGLTAEAKKDIEPKFVPEDESKWEKWYLNLITKTSDR